MNTDNMADDTKITVWITKYALTQGIFSGEATICATEKTGNMIALKGPNTWSGNQYFHGHGKDWTDSYKDALKIADRMRLKKIESLKKQIKNLEQMTFDKQG